MGSLFTQILPLALGAAVSPTVLVANLLVLSSSTGARAKGLAFAFGAASVLAIVTLLAMTVLHVASTTGNGASRPGAVLDVVGALLLLVLGIRTLRRPPKQARATEPDPSPVALVGLGAVMMATNLTTLLLYIPAAKDISVADVALPDKVAATTFLYAVTLAVVWVPLALTLVSPTGSRRVLAPLNRFVTTHTRTISVAVCFGFAAYLAIKGGRTLA